MKLTTSHDSIIRTFLAAHVSFRRIGRGLGVTHTTVIRRVGRDLQAQINEARAEIARADAEARQETML